MPDHTDNTPLIDVDLHSRMLTILQTYPTLLSPGITEIAVVTGIKWKVTKGFEVCPALCNIQAYNPRTDRFVWIWESHFASDQDKTMLHSSTIGDIILYKHVDDPRMIRNFDMERRIAAAKQAFIDFSKPSK